MCWKDMLWFTCKLLDSISHLHGKKNDTFSAGVGEKILWPALYGTATPVLEIFVVPNI